jgi:hypothetical protein
MTKDEIKIRKKNRDYIYKGNVSSRKNIFLSRTLNKPDIYNERCLHVLLNDCTSQTTAYSGSE